MNTKTSLTAAQHTAYQMSRDIAEFAAKHSDDVISNALVRFSQKIDKHGTQYPLKMTRADRLLLAYYKKHRLASS